MRCLLLAVAERDMGAFRTLYERHAGWLAIRLARRCNDRDLVADAIQDTFIAVWQRPQGFRGDGDGDIAAWLWGIAIRRAGEPPADPQERRRPCRGKPANPPGRVWLADRPDPAATVFWRTGTGRYRNVAAHARDGVEHVEPSLEDAYLLLRGGSSAGRARRGGGVMTTALAPARPEAAGQQGQVRRAHHPRDAPLRPQPGLPRRCRAHRLHTLERAAKHGHRDRRRKHDRGGLLGGFGMLAAFWLIQSMRASEPVVGVAPAALPARTAALCATAIVPFGCGCLTLLAFLHFHPIGDPVYGAFGPSARIAVLVGQIVVPSLGGPLLGVALGRWDARYRAPRSCCS